MSERLLLRRTQSEPTPEYLKLVSPAWLGGLFDGGGTIEFCIIPNETAASPYVDPRVKIVDRSPDRLYRLQGIAGGHVYKANGASHQWVVTGQHAIDLVQQAAPFMPSRQAAVMAFTRWAEADSARDKMQIANAYKTARINNLVPFGAYQFLIDQPEVLPLFTAGVIDCRGNFYTITGEPVFNQLTVSSTNTTLLEILQQLYGGSYHKSAKKGDSFQIQDHKATANRDSGTWTVTKDMLANLLITVGPCLQLLTPPSD